MSANIFMIYGRPEVHNLATDEYFDYGLFYVFDSLGLVELEALEECYKEVYERTPLGKPCFGPFDSQDDLTRFAFKLCEKREADRAIILSREEYNQALEESHSKEELLTHLADAGRSVENLEGPRKGLLGKFFRS